jgi:hypothetical protein
MSASLSPEGHSLPHWDAVLCITAKLIVEWSRKVTNPNLSHDGEVLFFRMTHNCADIFMKPSPPGLRVIQIC